MANKIQIKRSSANAVVTGLSNGELAYTQASNTLYIGLPDGSGVLRIAGGQYPGTLTANQALVANSTSGIDKVITANLVTNYVTANGSLGTAGYVLSSSGSSANVYWVDPATLSTNPAGSNTQIQFNNSGSLGADADFTWDTATNTLSATNISGNGASITSVDAATVGGNTASDLRSYSDTIAGTAYSNATSYADTAAGTAYSNATSYADTAAGTAYSNATSYADTAAGTAYSNAIAISAANTYVNNTFAPKANPTFTGTLNAADVVISGNLDVNGTLTTIDTTNMAVTDSIISLARSNASDTLDIGFYGLYNDGSNRYTGLIWDTSTDTFELFANTTAEPTTTINTGGVGYTTAKLKAYLESSGLVSNSSVTNITANSTVSVAIVANTLSLSTALPSTSGGTGLSSITEDAILVGNSSGGFDQLGLGTDGYVLQSNGTALIYDVLDGGTF